MTVAELIAILQTLPADAVVGVPGEHGYADRVTDVALHAAVKDGSEYALCDDEDDEADSRVVVVS